MKKRIASLLMAVVMLASLGVGSLAATSEKTLVQGNNTGLSAANFKDLADATKPDGRHWAWDAIDHVVKFGLFNGTSATTFAPQNGMTRAQFVVVITRLENTSRTGNNKLNVERVPTKTRFTDVPEDMWCAGAVAWAEANGIVEGYSDNTFKPNQVISRAQIAAFVYRYVNNYKRYTLKTVVPTPAQFTDFADAHQVFQSAINYCRTHGLIQGYGDHSLKPNIAVTRAQVAAILSRIIIVLQSRGGGGGGGGGFYPAVSAQMTGLFASGLAEVNQVAGNNYELVIHKEIYTNRTDDNNSYTYDGPMEMKSLGVSQTNSAYQTTSGDTVFQAIGFYEKQALGLYDGEYHDGIYGFTWDNTTILTFNVETAPATDYTYDLSVKAALGSSTISNPTLNLTGRSATETIQDLAKLLNDNVDNANQQNGTNLRSTIESVIQSVENQPFNYNKPELLRRIMRETIEDRVKTSAATYAANMKSNMPAADWQKTVQDGIWAQFQKSDQYDGLKSYIDASQPVYINPADADKVVVNADTTMIDNMTTKVVAQVETRLDDLAIGAKLAEYDPANLKTPAAGYDKTEYVERYYQVQGSATNSHPQTAAGEDEDTLVLNLPTNMTVNVSLGIQSGAQWPDYYLRLNPTGKAFFAQNDPANYNATVGGLKMGSLKDMLEGYTKSIAVGAQDPITVDLTKVSAGVPVKDVLTKDTLDNQADRVSNRLSPSAQTAFDDEIFGTTGAFVVVADDLETTADGMVVLEVLADKNDAAGKETVLHVTTDPDNWVKDDTGAGEKFDAGVDRAQKVREARTKDGNATGNTYDLLNRGAFGANFNSAVWGSSFGTFDAVDRGSYNVKGTSAADAQYAAANVVAKTDSTLADLWRTLGLSEGEAGNTLTFSYTKGLTDPTKTDVLDALLGTHEGTITITVTRNPVSAG